MYFIILPNTLFEFDYINTSINKNIRYKNNKDENKKDIKHTIIVWENPHYFKDYNFNKKKLILHRSSMKYYYDSLIEKIKDKKYSNYKVKYVDYNKKLSTRGFRKDGLMMFDPINDPKMLKIPLLKECHIVETPNFLLTLEDYDEYRKKTDKFFFYFFYMWGKKKIDIIPNVKSKDKDNRKRLPKSLEIPPLPTNTGNDSGSSTKQKKEKNKRNIQSYINEAGKYIDKHFPKNYGSTDYDEKTKDYNFIFPIDRDTAHNWLKNFIIHRFSKFGDYQDFVDKENSYLFHSVLSTSINIGLLHPTDIINIIRDKDIKNIIPINSYEGYIRQLFWREYQRFCYIHYDFGNKNYFGNKKKLTSQWYTGDLGIPPVDDCIKKAFKNGYINHIERLMVVGNYMNLYGIDPKEGFKWFMEFSCDSYEWVMFQNVLDMVFFVSGGDTMRRPYASSSNYIIKMSNYKKGEWSKEWDDLYQDFLKRNKQKLWKYRYYFRGLKKYE